MRHRPGSVPGWVAVPFLNWLALMAAAQTPPEYMCGISGPEFICACDVQKFTAKFCDWCDPAWRADIGIIRPRHGQKVTWEPASPSGQRGCLPQDRDEVEIRATCHGETSHLFVKVIQPSLSISNPPALPDKRIFGFRPYSVALVCNEDDDDHNDQWDSADVGPCRVEDDLYPMQLDSTLIEGDFKLVYPEDKIGVFAHKDKTGFLGTGSILPAAGKPWILYLEGRRASSRARDVDLVVEQSVGGEPGCSVMTNITIINVDLDIDSDNSGPFDPPQRTPEEDQIEASFRLPGKYMVVNDGDVNGDGIPNFADGYDCPASGNPRRPGACGPFVPIVVSIPRCLDPARVALKFEYNASDPASVTVAGSPPQYTPADGDLRIWARDGTEARDRSLFGAPYQLHPGDYVAPGIYCGTAFGHTRPLYVEAIQPGLQEIIVSLDPDGTNALLGFECSDTIRYTTLKVDLDIDSDNDGVIDDKDDPIEEINASHPAQVDPANNIFKIGRHINVNDFDLDADGIPDYADGIGKLPNDGGRIERGEFTKIEIARPVPGDLKGFYFRFSYSSSDPNGISGSPSSLVVPPGRLRLWTKDACMARNPQSVVHGGDFIPENEVIPASSLMMNGDSLVLCLEGISASDAWGDATVGLEVLFDSGNGNYISVGSDTVSATVTKSRLTVFVWRPYVYSHQTTERHACVTDYSTPRTAFVSAIDNYIYGADLEGHHGADASLGHAFLCLIYNGPSPTALGMNTLERWSGQTGGPKGGKVGLFNSWSYFRKGEAFWEPQAGRENETVELIYIANTYSSASAVSIINFDGNPVPMVASHDFVLYPKKIWMLANYINHVHDFSRFGLDINETGGGCASFVGQAMTYAGFTEQVYWEMARILANNNQFPVVPFDFLPLIPDENKVIEYLELAEEAYVSNPLTSTWGVGKDINYFDTAYLAIWIDGMHDNNHLGASMYKMEAQ